MWEKDIVKEFDGVLGLGGVEYCRGLVLVCLVITICEIQETGNLVEKIK